MICIWKCTSSIYLSLESGQSLRLRFCVYQLFCLSIPNYLKLSHKAHTLFTHGSAIWARLSWVVPVQVPPVVISVAALTCELLQVWLSWHARTAIFLSLYSYRVFSLPYTSSWDPCSMLPGLFTWWLTALKHTKLKLPGLFKA